MKLGSGAPNPADSLVVAASVQQKSRAYPTLLTHVLHLRTGSKYQSIFFLHVTNCGDNCLSRNANHQALPGETFFLSFRTSFVGKNQSTNPQVPQTRS
jgi:hypothetical protein